MPEQSAGGKRRPSFRLWGAKKPADGGGGAAHTRHALLVVQTQEAAARQQLATQCAQAAARLARGRPNRSAAGGVEVELHTPPAAVPAGTPTAGSPLCVSTPPPVLLRSPSTIAEAPSPAATPFTPGDPPETRVRRIFDAFDGDGDGRWAFEDVRVWGMVCMGSITTRGDYAALCARVGADLEGGLALRHVVEWYARDFDARAVDAHYAACVALERATPPAEVHLPPRPSSQLRAKSYHAPPTPPLAHLTPPNVPRRTPSPPSPGTPSRAISRRGSHVPPRERPVLPVTPLSAPPSWHGGCRTCFDDGGGDAIELVELRPTAAARPEAPMPGPGPSARLGSAPPEASVVCRPLFTDAPGVEAEAEAEGHDGGAVLRSGPGLAGQIAHAIGRTLAASPPARSPSPGAAPRARAWGSSDSLEASQVREELRALHLASFEDASSEDDAPPPARAAPCESAASHGVTEGGTVTRSPSGGSSSLRSAEAPVLPAHGTEPQPALPCTPAPEGRPAAPAAVVQGSGATISPMSSARSPRPQRGPEAGGALPPGIAELSPREERSLFTLSPFSSAASPAASPRRSERGVERRRAGRAARGPPCSADTARFVAEFVMTSATCGATCGAGPRGGDPTTLVEFPPYEDAEEYIPADPLLLPGGVGPHDLPASSWRRLDPQRLYRDVYSSLSSSGAGSPRGDEITPHPGCGSCVSALLGRTAPALSGSHAPAPTPTPPAAPTNPPPPAMGFFEWAMDAFGFNDASTIDFL